jgi:hypothetical protein
MATMLGTGKPDPLCGCKCRRCIDNRERLLRLWRMSEIERRLLKAGIDPNDLAELVRIKIVDSFEAELRTMAEEAVHSCLVGITLVSQVKSNYQPKK